jgi:dTDP-4-dehydrorhamnose 3,5-epimerase
MKFEPGTIAGSYTVSIEPRGDDRGGFARVFCSEEFGAAGIEPGIVQINTSWSRHKGTLRGLHHQLAPAGEAKLVRCIRGAVYDVAVDLRPDSPTFLKSFGTRLDADTRLMMYSPPGTAHGYLTLTDDAEVIYSVSAAYRPELERGVRWNDPAFAIDWPIEPLIVSPKDEAWPDFRVPA